MITPIVTEICRHGHPVGDHPTARATVVVRAPVRVMPNGSSHQRQTPRPSAADRITPSGR
jgi:hypothetical protein